MRVVRVLIYDMPDKEMTEQLGSSMNDGTKVFANKKIHVFTLPSTWKFLRLLKLYFNI